MQGTQSFPGRERVILRSGIIIGLFARVRTGAVTESMTIESVITKIGNLEYLHPVSYTHLTLPTNREESVSWARDVYKRQGIIIGLFARVRTGAVTESMTIESVITKIGNLEYLH